MPDIKGVIDSIVFQNEENGYTIAKMDSGSQIITLVGILPYLTEGNQYRVTGEWVVHPKFGEQLKVDKVEEVLPTTASGIEKYLASGVVAGIGPVTAKKIVDFFGEKALDVLDNNIERLNEIKGIGTKKIELITRSYTSQREVRNIIMFFQNFGVSPNQCMKIYKRFGSNSINVIKDNPYILTETVSGIGFKTADNIARSLGIDKDSSFRIKSGINYVINEFCGLGNTFMPIDKLLNKAKDILQVEEEVLNKNIYEGVLEGKLKVEDVEDIKGVFTIPYLYAELGVTKKIVTLVSAQYDNIDIDINKTIKSFETENGIILADSQKGAIKGAIDNGIEVITGGPGTGKTTIINCIVDIFENLGMKVFMAAPTGRAAKRMSEATGREAKTIHRLLELGAGEEEVKSVKGEDSPLECDVLIVDEASMIDINLMNNLLSAVAFGTRLIIVGDVDQLPSVGPGNVLRDIIESNTVKVVRLNEIFRQGKESMIVVNAHLINEGKMPMINKKDSDFYFIESLEVENILNQIVSLINTRLPKFNKSWDKIRHIQILSPMRKGIVGVDNLNKELQHILNPKGPNKLEKEYRDMIFRVGDKVMQTKNNYSINWVKIMGSEKEEGVGVFNGDVGYIIDINEDDNTVVVNFEDDKIVEYEDLYLDELTLAYAITIHKSQGSEFPVVIMPMFMGPPLLMNRNLLYTGITRAKQMVVLVGNAKAVQFMKDNDRSFERYSGLKWRIKQIFEI
jgi:exodeoxyribonuclease V alpha subunit